MEFFDSHSHYNDDKFNEDREDIIEKTYESGVTKFVCAGYNIPSSILFHNSSFVCGISFGDIPIIEYINSYFLDNSSENIDDGIL